MGNSGGDGATGHPVDDDIDPPTRSVMPAHALPVGTRILDYQILALLGEGGFGIVYLALDVQLERQVAIKEYLPTSIAWRGAGSLEVAVRTVRDEATFALGLRSFVNEARLLARFDHPSLIKVHRFWEENGTAYMVMPFYRGRTLQRTLQRLGRRPGEAELRAWLAPLMDALQVMHAENCYHRDISPDNILITDSGPMLLDFGAARRVIGDMQRALTVVLKPGFAPIEQYGDTPGLQQGPWTDVYALAGMLFAAITGRRPPPAVSRLMDDPMPKVSEVAAGQYSAAFLLAIDRGLALRPRDRPQSVAEFRVLLDDEHGVAPPATGTVTAPVDLDLTQEFLVAPAAAGTALPPAPAAGAPAAPSVGLPLRSPMATRQRLALLVAASALVALLGLGYSLFRDSRGAAVGTQRENELVTLPAPAPAPAPVLAPAPAPPSTTAPAPAPAPPSEPLPTPPPPATEPAAITPAKRPAPPAPRPAPTAAPADLARCSDILKKGSLEPLTNEETAFLRRHCQ